VIVTLSFPHATGTTTCTNPGSTPAPGRNPGVPVSISGTALVTPSKNGALSFTVTTTAPSDPTPQQAGCPNGQWTAEFNNITFGSGTLTIQQDQCGPPNSCYNTVLSNDVYLP
jgi:hypothetical protein